MKTWRIHLLWSVVAVVSAAAWGKHVGGSRETEFRERERIHQVKVVQATAAAAQAPAVVVAPAPVAVAPAAAFPAVDVPAAEYEIHSEERPTVEQLRKLMQDKNDVWRAYQVIQRMTKGDIRTRLTRELFQHKEAEIRRAAVHLLREALGDEAAAPIFQETLRKDPDSDVREQVAQVLGYGPSPGNVEALLQAFRTDESKVQLACAYSLSQLGQPGPASEMVPRFAALVDSPDGAVRREAIEALGMLPCPQSLPLLARALRDTNGDVRLAALNSLWDYTEDTQVLPLVEPLLNDPVAGVRSVAKDMVEQLKAPKE